MYDPHTEVGRLAASNPAVLRFFQQARNVPGCNEALEMLIDARGRAMQCLLVHPHAAGSYHLARFNGHLITRELAAIAGCTHLSSYTTEQLDSMQLFEEDR